MIYSAEFVQAAVQFGNDMYTVGLVLGIGVGCFIGIAVWELVYDSDWAHGR